MKIENVKIEKLDNLGRGIVRVNNKVIFVENALPEEIVDIEITKEKKNYSIARTINILHKSKYRKNICKYSEFCGGCDLINLEYNKQLEYKSKKVGELIKKAFGDNVIVNDIIYDTEFEYRNKILLHIYEDKLGFYEKKSNSIIDIEKCMLVNHNVNCIIKRIRDFIKENKGLSSVVIRTSSYNEIMLIFKGDVSKDKILEYFLDIDVIVLNNKTIKGVYIREKLGNKEFLIYPNSFFQVNMFNTKKLYDEVRRLTYNKRYNSILDLYCGTGTIGIILSDKARTIMGIEIIDDAVVAAKKNAQINDLDNINFICGKAEDYIDKFSNVDLIIVDPPRVGLDKTVISNIKRINPREIIYVSCDVMTFIRDVKSLEEEYSLKEVTPVDMFPNTHHVECVCVLKLK